MGETHDRPHPRPVEDPTLAFSQMIGEVRGPVLVLSDPACEDAAAELAAALPHASAVRAGDRSPKVRGRWQFVVLMASDAAGFRRAVPVLRPVRTTLGFGWWLAEAETAPVLVPRGEWPAVLEQRSHWAPGSSGYGVAHFEDRVGALRVYQQLARTMAPSRGGAGLFVATTPAGHRMLPPADADVLLVNQAADAADPEIVVPPDVVLGGGTADDVPEHDVIGRAPVVVHDLLGLAPLDEGVLNPTGFVGKPSKGAISLASSDGVPHFRDGDRVDPARGLTARHVERLRDFRSVQVTWPEVRNAPGPVESHLVDLARVVAGLAIAGVPVEGAPRDAAVRELLTEPLAALLEGPPSLEDDLHREEHSIRLRRAGLLAHSTGAWRQRLAGLAGTPWSRFPTVTVVMATRRPEKLDFALRQVAKQRVDVELVLATHGFRPDPGHVQALLGDRAVTLLDRSAEVLFGDVLAAATAAASGDLVIKMDDDDWYGRDFVGDLLLARDWSRADLLGTTTEMLYLEPVRTTIRREERSEEVVRLVVGGGSMMLDRSFLRELGGFRPVRRYVDASLLASARAAGAKVYRGHGLGHCYRRGAAGHTWDPGLDYFLDEERVLEKWDGFRPSALLEYDATEVP